ncbi:MAG: holo-ACP synthase [Rhabdochlamydiaceae bacterium]
MLGLGTDIIEIERIQKAIDKFELKFLNRIFSINEQNYCLSQKQPFIFFAARFAAKEAVSKAIGCGIGQSLSWLDIEIRKDEKGKPFVVLHEERMKMFDYPNFLLSLSHCRLYATATVIAYK